jgi:hypothetical protein
MAGFDQVRPGQLHFACGDTLVDARVMPGRGGRGFRDNRYIENASARAATRVAGQPSHWRCAVVTKVRVLTS